MTNWHLYEMDCEFTEKEPTILGFVAVELYLLWERIEDWLVG